ncbi:CRISPR-associated endonuclease Cas3'' [Anaerococcus nagyae]|uniref:CRISPR-associated endonuclease Cas3 n=1 Tax=Anaerococcus nagyae TaxID=1755241 RepID=A0A3E2TJD4_9FIRM|nr:CRISPR-associated endonuclease Cas3'' [Anaerococcus nagyae]RGB76314.1 CRISPR-associated endonuclease Cas3'' [Anaerococcus nagyae]
MIIAHKDENGREQSLFNHLINVGNGSFNLGKQLDNEYISLLVGLLHDLGKADPLFQDKIMNNKNTSVNHSSAGAKYLYQIYCKVGEKNENFKSPIC